MHCNITFVDGLKMSQDASVLQLYKVSPIPGKAMKSYSCLGRGCTKVLSFTDPKRILTHMVGWDKNVAGCKGRWGQEHLALAADLQKNQLRQAACEGVVVSSSVVEAVSSSSRLCRRVVEAVC